MATTQARPDLRAHQSVIRMDEGRLAQEATDLLGARLVAYIAGVSETRAVREWINGARRMRADSVSRLREALTVALTIREADDAAVVQAWFQGLNPQLDDRSPAHLLREGAIAEVGPEVRQAARAFLVGG